MKTFSATVRSGKRRGSWWTTAMPSARAWAGPRIWIGSPSRLMLPLSGWWTPARILTSVLLPAPFSPTSAWTSPATRSSETSSSAWVAANRFEMPAELGRAARSPTARPIVTAAAVMSPATVRRVRRSSRAGPRCRAPTSSSTIAPGRCVVGQHDVDPVGRAEGRERGALPFRVVDDGDDLARGGDHRALICASSSVASASPDSMVNPAAPRNAFWTLIRLNSPSPSCPTTDSASQRTRPPSMSDADPRVAGQLRGDAQAVGDDGQLAASRRAP